MKVSDETLTWGGKAIALIASLFVIKKVANIFKGPDGKFSQTEFGRFVGFWFFLWAATYVILTEGNRPANTQHVFSEMWLFLIFSGLLTVLHLDSVLVTFLKFRSKTPAQDEPKKDQSE